MAERRDDPSIQVRVGPWLAGTGPESDIVLSSRVRIARNLAGFPLKARLGTEEEAKICDLVEERIEGSPLHAELAVTRIDELDPIDRTVWVERHLISLEHANATGRRSVVKNEAESVAVMVNEEDHVRIQAISSGLSLDESFANAQRIHAGFEELFRFVFHPRFGYLTSCPTNVGSGMRISVMLHLPALVFTKQIDKFFNAVAKMNLAVRGFYGEGTKALSDLYQISNQVTLGKTPEMLLDSVRQILPKVISFEREVRRQLFESDRLVVEDRLWRAYGTLRHARSMTSEEAFELLSIVRMGVHAEVFQDLDLTRINRLFMLVQPGHLQQVAGGGPLEAQHRDSLRATLIRQCLQN
jgi:protein arginine kinase